MLILNLCDINDDAENIYYTELESGKTLGSRTGARLSTMNSAFYDGIYDYLITAGIETLPL